MCRDVNKAAEELGARGPLTDGQLHDVRRRLKRARAGLRLLRPVLGRAAFRRENAALRDAARCLTAIRDAKVLVDSVDGLAKHAALADRRALLVERAVLLTHRREVRQRFDRDRKALDAARRALAAAAGRIGRRSPGSHGWSVLGEGLRRVYRTGRDSLKAVQASPSVENLHELRKQAKYLWYALEALEAVSPEIKRLSGQAHRLSHSLGLDHDLAVLFGRLRQRREEAPSDEIGAVMRLVIRRRERLQTEAMALAGWLYKKKPGEFAKRLGEYWDDWR